MDVNKHRPKMKLISDPFDIDWSNGNVIAMAKADGEFNILFYNRDGETWTLNRYGKTKMDFPALHELKALLRRNMPNARKGTFVVELYAKEGGRPLRLPDYIHNMKSKGATKVNIGVWNIVNPIPLPYKNPLQAYFETIRTLERAFKGGDKVHVLPWEGFTNAHELKRYFELMLDLGWEGLVVRQQTKIFKLKPIKDCDCVIIGINKKDGKLLRRNQIGSVKIALMFEKNRFVEVGDVGSGFTQSQREQLYKTLMQTVIAEDRKTIWVFPSVIVEIAYTELFDSENMVYGMRTGELGQTFVEFGKIELIRFRYPRFKRFRFDKTVTPEDLRTEQIGKEVIT